MHIFFCVWEAAVGSAPHSSGLYMLPPPAQELPAQAASVCLTPTLSTRQQGLFQTELFLSSEIAALGSHPAGASGFHGSSAQPGELGAPHALMLDSSVHGLLHSKWPF